jgi:hypothetical protein
VTTLNYRLSAPALVFLAIVGSCLVPERCDAQVPQLPSPGTLYRVPYYSVEVQYYVTPLWLPEDYEPSDSLFWIVIRETESYEKATAYYEYLLLAKEQGILSDIVPTNYWYPEAVDVRMVTKYRTVYVRN